MLFRCVIVMNNNKRNNYLSALNLSTDGQADALYICNKSSSSVTGADCRPLHSKTNV